MEKSKLQSFINRYYLAGNCEAVVLKNNTDTVCCDLIDVDQTVVGKIKWKTDPFMNGELGINHTGALIKMLSAVGEQLDIDVQSASGKNYAIKISEGSTKATFMLADTTVIPGVPTINEEPEYQVTLDINDELWIGLQSDEPYTGDFRHWNWISDISNINYKKKSHQKMIIFI